MMVPSGVPFLDEITNTSHNSEFNQPELPKYDNATSNPIEYLINFKSTWMLYARDGALMCKVFPVILRRNVLHSSRAQAKIYLYRETTVRVVR